MKVTVRLHATLRKYLPEAQQGETTIELPEGTAVSGALARLAIPEGHARMIVSDGEHLTAASVLRDGQAVDVFPPIAGG